MLSSFANADPRVRVAARRINGGISKATNDALAMARGEFVVLLDHDDKLRPHTLAAFVRELAIHPDLDAIYSDEDKIAPDGRRILPFFKPDFSPEFLRGVMYIGHALCVRTSIARAAGGFDPQYDGIQDYEFLLRVTEHTRKVGHTPHILYHWRQSATSSALHGNVKGNMDKKQSDAVRAHLRRVGDLRTVVELGGHRVRMEAGELPTYDVIAFENPKDLPIHLATAARSSQAEVLVLMARPIEAEGKACVRELVALAALPDSGCVGPVILSGDDRVLESGRIGEQPIMLGFHADSDGYNGSLRCNREVDALSPVCIAIKRTLLTACPESAFREWRALCNELRARGFYHRICAAARVQFPLFTTLNPDEAIDGPLRREFYNNHFDRQTGDYALLPVTSQLDQSSAPFVFNVEQPEGWSLISRCLIVRGWCFLANGRPIAGVRLRAQDRVLAGVVGLSRPDVTEAWPNSSGVNPGFELRGTLPSGKFNLALDAQLPDGRWLNFAHYSVHVGSQFLPLWLGGGDWMELMFFQMPAHMAYPPKKVALEKFPTNASQAKHPRISIVTPSFNQAGFLPETMRSVLDQTGVACDYVVQDGGSTDGSAALIKDQSQRLTAWASERDSGQAGAIAQGFAKTSGGPDDLMAWINSDDYYLPGALAFVSDYFARHPAVDVLYGHRVVVDEESQEIARWFLPKHDPEVLRLNDFVPQETLFWRRRIWDKVGGIDTSFKFAMDWDLLLRFQAAGARIVRVPYFLACFRVHSAQKTSARMHDIGQQEITRLRERTHGRTFPAAELEKNPTLLRYLRRSAFIEFLWKLGLRAP
jgi:glycosyltransferase involved in cell wall biosynthesis